MKENVEVGSVTPGICQLQGRNQLKDLVKKVALDLSLDGLINPVSKESGGLSGKPLFSLSNGILTDMYILTKGKIPLVGYGGVSSGEDAYKKIRAGAKHLHMVDLPLYLR